MARYTIKLGWILGAMLIGYFTISVVVAQVRQSMMRDDIINICAAKHLYAIDMDYPHSPKCLDRKTGIMTVPDELLDARGGRM